MLMMSSLFVTRYLPTNRSKPWMHGLQIRVRQKSAVSVCNPNFTAFNSISWHVSMLPSTEALKETTILCIGRKRGIPSARFTIYCSSDNLALGECDASFVRLSGFRAEGDFLNVHRFAVLIAFLSLFCGRPAGAQSFAGSYGFSNARLD